MADAEVLKKNLESMERIMERIMACLDAQIEFMGKGSLGIIYQAGKDAGKADGQALDKSEDLGTALALINASRFDVWNSEIWKDAGRETAVVEEDGVKKAHVVFRECPIRQVCLSQGVPLDGTVCRLAHGYYAGLLAAVLDKKVDLQTIAAGPNACKKEASWH